MSPSCRTFRNVTCTVCALMATFALTAFVTPLARSQPQAAPGLADQLKVLSHVTVTVLADNLVADTRVLGEWGLAMLVDTGQRRVLFDTGGGRVLAGNARALHVDLSKVDAIVISHGHDDHTGGLAGALDATGKTDIFVHPAVFGTTYWKEERRAVPYSMSMPRSQLAVRARRIVETEGPTLVTDGIMVTGGIPRVTDFEDTGITTEAFRDSAMKAPDAVPDDQALFFRTPDGVVILFGCGHAGVVNTIRYVSELLGENRIFAAVGGTHLLSASPLRIQKTEEAFQRFGLQKIMLSHCTGLTAFSSIAAAFPGRCSWPAAGSVIEFGK